MAKTFREAVWEMENWHHSREHYELMKECKELELMSQFLDDQQFYAEEVDGEAYEDEIDDSDDGYLNIDESYFLESVDDDHIKTFTEARRSLLGSLLTKIYRGFLKIVNVFRNLLGRIGNKFDDTTKKGQSVLKALNKKTAFTDAEVNALIEAVGDALEKSEGFIPASNQSYDLKINSLIPKSMINGVSLRAAIAAALSDKVVTADVRFDRTTNKNSDKVGALSCMEIKKIGSYLISGDQVSIKTGISYAKNVWVTAQAKGIDINVNTNNIKKDAEALKKIQDELTLKLEKIKVQNDVGTAAVAGVAKAAAGTTKSGVVGQVANGLTVAADTVDVSITESINILYGMIQVSIGAAIKMYTGLNTYRIQAISGIQTVLNGTAKTKTADAPAEEPAAADGSDGAGENPEEPKDGENSKEPKEPKKPKDDKDKSDGSVSADNHDMLDHDAVREDENDKNAEAPEVDEEPKEGGEGIIDKVKNKFKGKGKGKGKSVRKKKKGKKKKK